MDKKYQDIFYLDGKHPSRLMNKVVWCVREVYIINMAFGDEDIVILYRDINGNYFKKALKKERFFYLQIS